jgi:polysaccharide pyruvyl transferase WcaK-like protein
METGLIGWNGKLNVGDDAMSSVIIEYILSKSPEARFSLLGDSKNLAVYSDNEMVKSQVSAFNKYGFLTQTRGISRFMLRYYYPPIFGKNKDAIIMGGGSIIHREPNSIRLINLLTQARKNNPNVKIGAVGISLGPFTNKKQRDLAQQILDLLDFVVVRDERSFSLLKSFKTKYSAVTAPDLAMLLPTLRSVEQKPKGNEKSLGISLRVGYVTDEVIEMMIKSSQILVNEYGFTKIKLFHFCALDGQKDSEPSDRLLSLMPKNLAVITEHVPYSYDPVDFYEEIAACNFMICMRLHASILSYCMGISFAIVPYRQKCIDFGKQVAGLDDNFFIREEDDAAITEERLNYILDNYDYQFRQLEEVKEKARINFVHLQKIFS